MLDAHIPTKYWDKANIVAVNSRNKTPCRSLNWMTPNENFFRSVPVVRHLRTFSCRAFVKLTNVANKGLFMGYALSTNNYLVLTKPDIGREINYETASAPLVTENRLIKLFLLL